MKLHTMIKVLVFSSFLVLAAPIYAEDMGDNSLEEIEAPLGEMTPPVDTAPPDDSSDPAEDEEGTSE